MMSQKSVLSAVFGKLIVVIYPIFALSFSMLSGSHATPGSGIVTSDQIIGTTSKTFFVIRTTTLRPPSYYEYKKRIELVELSIASGAIEQQCLVRETAYEYDFDASQETWEETELVESGCQVFDVLTMRGANYIEPQAMGPHYHEFRLTAEGLLVRKTDHDDPRPWQMMVALADIKTRAAEMTKITRSILSWQTDDELGDTFSLFSPDDEYETLPDICELNAAPVGALRQEWVFQKFVCWSGDDDSYGAIFYLPVKAPPVDE